RGRAVVHLAQARHGAGGEQYGFDEGCLADATVTNDADVADLADFDRHQPASLGRAMRWGRCYHRRQEAVKPRPYASPGRGFRPPSPRDRWGRPVPEDRI